MAITIYKFAYHVDRNTQGVARTSGGGNSSAVFCDLSNYYTKSNLLTPGEALIDSRNIFWAIQAGAAASYGVATVSGRLIRDGLIKGSANGAAIVIGVPVLTYGGVVPVDNILNWDEANSWYAPYAARTVGGFDSGSTNPNGTTRLNWNGIFYARQLNAIGGTTYGIYGYATTNYGLWGEATSGIAIFGQTTDNNGMALWLMSENHVVADITRNSVLNNNIPKQILRLDNQWDNSQYERGPGPVANGTGGYVSFYSNSDHGSMPETTRIVSILTDVTHAVEDSALEIWLRSGGSFTRKVKIDDTGILILDTYGSGTHTGTATKLLGVDATGNVIEEDITGGGTLPFQIATADSLGDYDIDATTSKDWIIEEVTDDATINLNNTSNGDAGMLEVIMDSMGGYTVTLGAMFTKRMGPLTLDTSAGADNIISWRKVGTSNIVYTIAQIE